MRFPWFRCPCCGHRWEADEDEEQPIRCPSCRRRGDMMLMTFEIPDPTEERDNESDR
jgi:hypothetical protein